MSGKTTRLEGYQIRLFVFLSVATFFEGYDFLALAQVLTELERDFGLSKIDKGYLVTFVNLGTIVAYVLVRHADRWGRKPMLTLTIAGYTTFTFLTGLAPSIIWFAVFQFIARIFLIAEWATSMLYAAEEFPADRRGMVIGVISAFSALGAVVCAGVTEHLIRIPWGYGWRNIYFVGIIPLVILAYFRRSLKESSRFAALPPSGVGKTKKRSLFHVWKTPHRKRVLQLGLIWGLTYVSTQTAVTFWKDFAISERDLSPDVAGSSIAIAAVVAMPLVFYAGRLIDILGRRRGAVIIFLLSAAGVFACYSVEGRWPLTVALIFGIFGASAVMPVLNAYNSELFPTAVRGDAYAWSNNLLGRISYVVSPIVVGHLAESQGWGPVVRWTAVGPILALIVILMVLPETGSKELEETAAV